MPNIPLSSVIISNRIRSDDPEVIELAESLKRYGQLQPILIDEQNNLLAGGRRCAAATLLGWTTIAANTRATLSIAEAAEIEFEENYQRRAWSWQEQAKSVAKIHANHMREAALSGSLWTQSMTAELLGQSTGYISQSITFAPILDQPIYKDCTSLADAAKVRLRIAEDAALAEQARRTKASLQLNDSKQLQLPGTNEPPGLSSLLSVVESEELSEESEVSPDSSIPIDISHTLFLGDCLELIPNWPDASVDHVITDPPYGIDMSFLKQRNAATSNVNQVESTHDVADNLQLFTEMFPHFFRIMKPRGFCILWCDIMNWDFLYWKALEAGFEVQRWPLIWHKTSQCGNEAAFVNWTKNYEIAMVCRKTGATLHQVQQSSIFEYPNDVDKVKNPFAKPYKVWRFLMEGVITSGQTILDPFCGSGSGLLSALAFTNKVIGIEKLETQYNILLEEYKSYWKEIYPNRQIIYV